MLYSSKCLWFTYCIGVGMILVNVAVSDTITRTEMDEESLAVQIELDEYDFEELCKPLSEYNEGGNTLENPNVGRGVPESLAESQREASKNYFGHSAGEYSKRTADITRKLELISKPGDIILRAEDYQHLLTFPERLSAASNKSVDCESLSDSVNETSEISSGANQTTCSYDEHSYLQQEYAHLLELVPKAAKLNGFESVELYWLMLSELPDDGYERAKALWKDVKPLYQKLSRWVSESIDKKCRPKDDSGSTSFDSRCDSILSTDWRSTHDWTNLAELVLQKECKETFHKIQANLMESQVTGKQLFEKTEKMTNILELGNLPSTFWKYSLYNQSCPTRYLDSCMGEFRAAACGNATWSGYLDAHEMSIRAISSNLSHSNNDLTFLEKNGNRFSALTEAVVGLGPLIAANRHYLSQQGVIKNAPCIEDTLTTLLALRIIPKLSYYLLADLARIDAVVSNGTENVLDAWRSLRAKDDSTGTMEGNDWRTFLREERIAANQPYISQFYGLFLQFQLFEELLKSDESVSDEGEEFIQSSQQIRDLLKLGKSKKWPVLLEDSFQISKIASAPLVRFFNRLDTFISPFIVPKDAKKIPIPLPNPDIPPKNVVEEATTTTTTTTTTTATSLPKISDDLMERNDTKTGETVEEQGENMTYIIGAVISCIVVGTIAIVIVAYRRNLAKRRQYQRPPDQQA